MRRPWLATIVIVAPVVAHAERITVKIVDVAGNVAYVEPGSAAGIVVGAKLKVGPIERTVTAASTTTASFALDGLVVAPGQSATADVVPGTTAVTAQRVAVHDAGAFRDQWPAASPPAASQTAKRVPLGAGREGGAVHLAVLGHAYASAGRDATVAESEARVVASFDVVQDRPLGLDADVAVRAFSEGYNRGERTPLFVRAAQLRYGDALDPNLVVGRLRWAATSVGMLDGGRVMVHAGDFEVAAFGGVVPDPVSGHPATDATRFGAEAVYDLAGGAWQPRLAVTASGSTWQGALDERRLAVDANATHGGLVLDGWAEAQAFPSGNPWGAAAIELTGAGASAGWHAHGDHLGIDASFLRPERSLRLAAVLPADWLCARVPQGGAVGEACAGGDYWATASATAGLRRGRFAVDGVASIGRSHDITVSTTSSAYIRGEMELGRQRLIVAGSAGKAELATWDAGELGIGSALGRTLDVEVRYRGELLDYVAATHRMLLHGVAADLRYLHSTALDLALSVLGTTGEDRQSVAALLTIAWRPLP